MIASARPHRPTARLSRFCRACGTPAVAVRALAVQVDFERLGLRLSRDLGRTVGPNEVRSWLNGQGLKSDGDWWVCDGDGAIESLKPDEVIQTRKMVTEHGVTFVEDQPPKPRLP